MLIIASRLSVNAVICGVLLSTFLMISPDFLSADERESHLNEYLRDMRLFDVHRFSSTRDRTLMIHVPAGVYLVTETIYLPSDSIFEGEGDATVLVFKAPFKGTRLITNKDFQRGNSNITLRSFKVVTGIQDLQKSDAPGIIRFENVSHLTITGLTMDINTDLYGIDLASSVQKAAVTGCNITNRGKGGCIMVRNRNPSQEHVSKNVGITHNTLASSADEPLAVFGWLGVVNNVTIHNNILRAGTASFGLTVYGIDSVKHGGIVHDVHVSNNSITGGRIAGIGIKGGAHSVEAVGNVISDTGGDGIFLHHGGLGLPGVRDIRIARNKILNAGRHCIFAVGADIVIERNEIKQCAESGVYVVGRLSVVDNVIANAKPGILIDGNHSVIIQKNSLHNAGRILFLPKAGGSLE